jgi:tRNA(Ile)-lysidine synthetase-like protein
MKYIVAVSGGVDSVVLLDQLMKKKLSGFESAEFAVAHFDHGVRDNSSGDAAFVQGLTSHYKVPFELGVAKLGAGVSEEVARDARYAFLREVQKKHRAVAVITAHHKDDVIETAIINILRGDRLARFNELRYHKKI